MTCASMPRSHRLAVKHDFTHCFDVGTRLKFSGGYAVAAPNTLGHARLGVIVSKKVCPRAVDRNRLRRWHKECFRRHQGALQTMDIVVVCMRAVGFKAVEAAWQSIQASQHGA